MTPAADIALDDPPNFVGKIIAEDHQEANGYVLRQSDRDFLIRVPSVHGETDRRSQHSTFFYFSVTEFPVDVDVLSCTFS